jgi:acetyltransferase-like isoleucine patch superfamily enzyme
LRIGKIGFSKLEAHLSRISPNASVKTDRIGRGAEIGDFAIIALEVLIGANAIIHPHVVINAGVEIGENVEIFPGAVVGKEPRGPGTLRRQPTFESFVKIGKGCQIGAHAVIYYDVIIGEFALIGDAAKIREQCRIGCRCTVGQNAVLVRNVVVGADSYIGNLVDLAGDTIIGQRVFIAAGAVTANTNGFGSGHDKEPLWTGVRIEDDSRIGVGAILLPGVVIGRRSTVAAGAVVTKDVPPDTVVMGIPARPVRDKKVG